MLPHKTARGQAALDRLKVYEGIPPPYDKVKRMVVPDALMVLRLQSHHKWCKLSDLASSVGWKHQKALELLEGRRKVKSAEFYKEKKRLQLLRSKAEAQVDAA